LFIKSFENRHSTVVIDYYSAIWQMLSPWLMTSSERK